MWEFCKLVAIFCSYDAKNFWNLNGSDNFYRCSVTNNPNIISRELAQIDSINGTHMSGKSNDDEIFFEAALKAIHYIPSNLDKIFTNLRGIALWSCGLKEICQSDMKPYTNLTHLRVLNSDIGVLEEGLFDSNPNLEYVDFEGCKMFHIHSKIFDDLKNLTTLFLNRNKCIDRGISKNVAGVREIIRDVKANCTCPSYLKLSKKLKELKEESKNLNLKSIPNFIAKFADFQIALNTSKIRNLTTFKESIETLTVSGKVPEIIGKYSKQLMEFSSDILKKMNPAELMMIRSLDQKIQIISQFETKFDEIKKSQIKQDEVIENLKKSIKEMEEFKNHDIKSLVKNDKKNVMKIILMVVIGMSQVTLLIIICTIFFRMYNNL